MALPDIKSLGREELATVLAQWKEPSYRADQVLRWLYAHRVQSWDAMTTLPQPLRERLARHYKFESLELVRATGSRDTTVKFLWRLADRSLIESVLIPANPALFGEPSDRHTLCVSSQVGCAYGCKFCASGLDGWKRNLEVHEIVDQVLAVERLSRLGCGVLTALPTGAAQDQVRDPKPETQNRKPQTRWVDNVVVMGMGEPLANYEHLLQALRLLNAPWGGGIGARKLTVSTSGLVPGIRRLADEPLQVHLAVSLHGATDAVRGRIMPVNRKYPLHELAAACRYYQEKKGRRLTFEYVLIADVNDGMDQVKPLAQLARRLNAKVNLIPYNTVEGLSWRRPAAQVQEAFRAALQKQKVKATLRREKGHEIDAACGQLRLKTERELGGRLRVGGR